MNREIAARAALAAAAGAAGALLIYILFYLLNRITLTAPISLGFMSGGTPADTWVFLIKVILYLLAYLTVLGVGGALPTRVFRDGWIWSFLSAAVAHLIAFLLAVLPIVAISGDRPQHRALVLLLGITLTMILAAKTDRRVLVAVALAAAILTPVVLVLASRYGAYIGLLSWPLIPVVAALAQTRPAARP